MPKKPIQIRIDDEEDKNWKQRAAAAGMNLSEWIRERCNATDRPNPMMETVPTEAPVMDKKPKARKSENAELVAGRTGHEVGCECFDCVQVGRFFKDMRKEA